MTMRSRSCAGVWALRWLASVLFMAAGTSPVCAEPEIHQRLEPLKPWMMIVEDPTTADSAWAGLAAAMPSFADSTQRGFGWYLMYSAAAALGHVDSMRVAAESSFVYSPNDPSAFRDLAQYLARANHHLELALASATRVIEVKDQPIHDVVRMEDLRWLGSIQMKLGQDSAAIATFEQRVKRSDQPNAWTFYRLGRLYARNSRPGLAIDRLTQGLSAFPQDSTDAAQASAMLDSLIDASGGRLDAVHARVARARAVSERRHWLDRWREGREAPKAAVVDLKGVPARSPGDERGITLVYAWATWCGPCRSSLPALQAWSGRPRTKPVRVVTLNAEGEPFEQASAKVEKFFAAQGLQLPVLMADSTAAARWKLGGFPMTLVLQDGRIVYRNHAGGLVEGVEAQLASLGSHPRH